MAFSPVRCLPSKVRQGVMHDAKGRETDMSYQTMTAAERRNREYVSEEQVQGWRKEFRTSASVRAEFVSEDCYAAFKKAEAQGRVSIMKSKA